MASNTGRTILAVVALAVVAAAGLYFGRRGPEESAQAPAVTPHPVRLITNEADGYVRDPYLRALKIYEFKKGAESGAERGREIFYYKCWFCHNEYAGPQSAPNLATVFERKQLLSGRPATEDGIKDEIKNGGAGMAAYGYTLSDADLNDLVAYLKNGCCWDSYRTPPNPLYRFSEVGE
jgi:mono/diheme cytochrome c family protein